MLKPTKFLIRSSITSRLLDFTHHMHANGFNTSFDQVYQSLKGLKHIDSVSYTHLTLPTR